MGDFDENTCLEHVPMMCPKKIIEMQCATKTEPNLAEKKTVKWFKPWAINPWARPATGSAWNWNQYRPRLNADTDAWNVGSGGISGAWNGRISRRNSGIGTWDGMSNEVNA